MFEHFDNAFSRLERIFLGSTILFTSLLLFVNVILRYIFHYSIYWAEELVRYQMVWLIFIGGSQVIKNEGHIRVDILINALPQKAQRVAAVLDDVISLAMLCIITWYSFHQSMGVRISHQVSPALELPMWIVYLAVPVGSALMSIRITQRLVKRLRNPDPIEKKVLLVD